MQAKFKYIYFIFFLLINYKLYSYEFIRDPIFENYFFNISEEFKLNKKVNVYLIKNISSNAFVINDSIYFTTGLLNTINDEDTLKAIFFHEYGHIIKNHFEAKNFNIIQANKKNTFYNLFSLGLAVLTTKSNLAIGTSITLNSRLVNKISKHSVNFEIEADNFMIDQIKKYKINTIELISFLNKSGDQNINYFKTHPRNQDRINNLKKFNFNKTINSENFNWIKSKYSNDSDNQSFNIFFKNLEKGIFNQKEQLKNINIQLIRYEAFKKGFIIDNWDNEFEKLLSINNNSFLKIEFISYILDNNLDHKYYFIEDLKFDIDLMNEFFYYYIYGKYYNKIDKINLSNFYFCQFYRFINSQNKADFFCKKYDIKDIPTLDKSYALFK